MRRLFVAPEGWLWAKIDFSQLELRVLAQASQDPFLVQAYQKGIDLHLAAAELMGEIVGRPGPELRTWAKTALSFRRVYGGSANKLLEKAAEAGLDLSPDQAQELDRRLNKQTPRVEPYRREVIAKIARTEESRTLFGRRRLFKGLRFFDKQDRAAAFRQGFNHVIQGTGGDIFKYGLLANAHLLGWDVQLVNMVHDEYDFLLKESGAAEWLQEMKWNLEYLPQLKDWNVPLVAEVTVGPNWADQKPLDSLG